MDQSNTTMRGLPRPRPASFLPQPGRVRIGSVDEGRASGLPTPGGRNDNIPSQRPVSMMGSGAGALSPKQSFKRSMMVQPGFQASSGGVGRGPRSLKSPTQPTLNDRPEEEAQAVSPRSSYSGETVVETPRLRQPRPSLSDRTIESLAQVPPSPSPAKRRQSGFFAAESSVRTPSRAMYTTVNSQPASSLSSRPLSRIGAPTGLGVNTMRPPSPSKQPTTSVGRQSSLVPPARRAVSSNVAEEITNGVNGPQKPLPKPSYGVQPPAGRAGLSRPSGLPGKPLTGSRTLAARPVQARSPVKDVFGTDVPSAKPNTPLTRTTPSTTSAKPPTRLGSELQIKKKPVPAARTIKASTAPRKPSLSISSTDEAPEGIQEKLKTQSGRTSQSLRDTIAKAKAATRTPNGAFKPRAGDEEDMGIQIARFGPDSDPHNLDGFNLEDSRYVNLIRKRVNAARTEGKLNIAALGLTEIPSEVLTMYDTPNEAGVSWYESVDVTKLAAADNEIARLPESAFPVPGEQANEDDEATQSVFSFLESIDLHGNKLTGIPPGLGLLEKLVSLNLARNKLDSSVLDILSSLPALAELRLGENHFKGPLPSSVGDLVHLQVLDLHSNGIDALPQELGRLSKLKRLNVADNRLSTIPFEAIFDLPLIEIIASSNRLNGSLFPQNVIQIPHLQVLDVSTNALIDISEHKVDMPRLQTLNISNNRVAALPDVSTWQALVNLNVEENKISAFPEGFTHLQNLENADFSNNSLLQIDPAIANMHKLIQLRIVNNPIRERRLMRITVTELKAEMQERLNAISQADVMGRAASPTTSNPRFSAFLLGQQGAIPDLPPNPAWPVTAGTCDRSSRKLRDIESKDLEPLVEQNVTALILHHNWLPVVPPTISLLGASLSSLDLSNNHLQKTVEYFQTTIHLPTLATLNLATNALTSLAPLTTNLLAPRLSTLILSFNRLASLPSTSLREPFPELTKVLLNNNQLTAIEVEAVRGLHMLDVSSNEIEALPARLALLQGTLRTLIVSGNRFRVPGYSVLNMGTEEVLNWCRMKIPAGEEGSLC